MSKNLVIVESPAKAKTIEKFLGKEYTVVASMWHIRDLPQKSLGINIEAHFLPEYEITKEKQKTVNELKKLAKTHPSIWIATDEDREWEAIGWHLCHILEQNPATVKRIVFHEITKEAILQSVKNPRNIDVNLVDAQQARRILDRLVGYKVSPVLWSKVKRGLSAGRVQSVAVKMIVEKEREIQAFIPQESWKITTLLNYQKQKLLVSLHKISGKWASFKEQTAVEAFFKLFGKGEITQKKSKSQTRELSFEKHIDFCLENIEKKDAKRTPWAPFTTSTLQQEASRKFGFWVKQTMMIAQKLYEWIDLGKGQRVWLITYMRTDSVNLSKNAIAQAAAIIKKEFGPKYHKSRVYKTKTSGAQEAHEAIRPTDLSKTPESVASFLEPQALKLYTLIYKRTLASQMADAQIEVTTLTFSPTQHTNQDWIAKGEVIQFDGFMKLYIESHDDEEESPTDEQLLPNISVWTILESKKINALQAFSRPPARYTEASLVKKLESEGIGRPSTYAPTISTIIDRGYVEKKEKKYLFPTDIAGLVTDFLQSYFSKMMDYSFTKNMEQDFDKIADGSVSYQKMLHTFWFDYLQQEIKDADKNASKVVQKTGELCPKCGHELVYKYSKTGKFIGCSHYPECDYIAQLPEEADTLGRLRAKYEGKPCPDGVEGTIVVKTGRFGPFLASSEYPKVKWIGKILSEEDEILLEILKEKNMLVDEETGEEMVVKKSRRGPFLAAKNYPEVKIAKNIPKSIWEELKKRLNEKEE